MLEIFRKLFKKAEVKKPIPGETWCLSMQFNGPWPLRGDNTGVCILDVKEGWVRYKVGGGVIFNDERMEVDKFTKIYSFLGDQAK